MLYGYYYSDMHVECKYGASRNAYKAKVVGSIPARVLDRFTIIVGRPYRQHIR